MGTLKYGIEVSINTKNKESAGTIRSVLRSGIPAMEYEIGQWEVKLNQTKPGVTVKGVLPEHVETALKKSLNNIVGNPKITYLELEDIVTLGDSGDTAKLKKELSIYKGKYNKIDGEYTELEKELKTLRCSVVKDKDIYEQNLEKIKIEHKQTINKILESKEILKEELVDKLTRIESLVADSPQNPIPLFIYGMWLKGDELKKQGNSYNKKLNFLSFEKNAEAKGINISSELLKEITGEKAETFDESRYFKTNSEEYKKAVDDLEFLEFYSKGTKFGIPEHRLKEIIQSIDKIESEKIKNSFETAKELFEIVKEYSVNAEHFRGSSMFNETIPFLVLSSFNKETYRVCVVSSVLPEDSSTLSKMILTHMKKSTGSIDKIGYDCGVQTCNLVGYKKEVDAKDIHKSTFKAEVNSLIDSLKKLEENSELAKAGFTVKILPYEEK